MIITITLNPAIDKTVEITNFEAGKLNRVQASRLDCGGKGINVSKVVKSLGGNTKAIGILGKENGNFITNYLNNSNINHEFVFIDGETRTNLKIFDNTTKIVTEINEPGPFVNDVDIENIESILFKSVRQDDIVVFTGSVPKNVDKSIYRRLIKALKKIGVKSVLDAEGDLLRQGVKEGPYLIKPNLYELEGLLGHKTSSIREVETFARSLVRDFNIKIVVVSLGHEGAIFVNKDQSVFSHGIKVDIKSTVGAGDAMVAALAYSIEKKLSFEKAITMSMAAATATTMVMGTQPATLESIKMIE
ncbi:MAG: 1-phosphofructokinase, partial [Clostridiaceae bacterium]|nr:1-phosphofructokinase [Clostridiaceae bacterium]